MSFRLGLKGFQEILVLILMLVLVFALFNSQMELTYKIGIAAMVFTIILLTTMATEALKQAEENKRLQAR